MINTLIKVPNQSPTICLEPLIYSNSLMTQHTQDAAEDLKETEEYTAAKTQLDSVTL